MTNQNPTAPTIGAKPPSKRLYTEEEVAAFLSGMRHDLRAAAESATSIADHLEAWLERDKAEMARDKARRKAEQKAALEAELRKPWWMKVFSGGNATYTKTPNGRG